MVFVNEIRDQRKRLNVITKTIIMEFATGKVAKSSCPASAGNLQTPQKSASLNAVALDGRTYFI